MHECAYLPGRSETIWQVFAQPFKPFEPLLWAVICCCLVMFSLAFFIADTLGKGKTEEAQYLMERGQLAYVGKSIFYSFSGFVGGVSHEPADVPTRFLSLAFQFFILLVVSAYTANLAS